MTDQKKVLLHQLPTHGDSSLRAQVLHHSMLPITAGPLTPVLCSIPQNPTNSGGSLSLYFPASEIGRLLRACHWKKGMAVSQRHMKVTIPSSHETYLNLHKGPICSLQVNQEICLISRTSSSRQSFAFQSIIKWNFCRGLAFPTIPSPGMKLDKPFPSVNMKGLFCQHYSSTLTL